MRKRIEIEVDMDEYELLRLLAKELHMEFALSDNTFYLRQTAWEDPQVWVVGKNGASDRAVDDRAELFVALRNLANAMCPNCEFRSESTIYDIEELII